MGPALGDLLPLAAAIALFPIPILAVILMLLSPRASANVPGFLAGWLTGLVSILVVTAMLTMGVEDVSDEDAGEAIGWVRIIIGVVLLLFALKKWLGRPDSNSDPEMPSWMSAIDDFTPLKALGAGLALTALNPKNIALIIGAGTAVGAPGLTTTESIAAGLVFTIVATLGVGVPPLYAMLGGSAARENLDAGKTWLIANNVIVMTLLMLIIGVVLVGEGLRLF